MVGKEREALEIDVHNTIVSLQADLAKASSELAEAEKQITLNGGDISAFKNQLSEFESDLAFENVSLISQKLVKETQISSTEHDFEGEYWGNYHFVLGIIATVISAIIGAGIFTNNSDLVFVAGILSLILIVVAALSTFLNVEQRSTAHYQAKTDFLVLSHEAESFNDIELKLRKEGVEDLAVLLKKLTDKRDELLKKTPRVSSRFHRRAENEWTQRQLEQDQGLISKIKEILSPTTAQPHEQAKSDSAA